MGRRECLAIGASMGGPKVLKEILPEICRNNICPIFIVQHIELRATECFRASLQNYVGDYSIKIGESLDNVQQRTVYLYPGFGHMRVMKNSESIMLNIFENGMMKNAVDALFSSVASVYGADCTAVVLTGMGIDGLSGSYEIKQAGGEVIVQDRQSSLVWSMPSAVAGRGLADRILSVGNIAKHVSLG